MLDVSGRQRCRTCTARGRTSLDRSRCANHEGTLSVELLMQSALANHTLHQDCAIMVFARGLQTHCNGGL